MVRIADPPNSLAQTLCQMAAGSEAVVSEVKGSASEISRLQALGVCQGRRLELVQAGDPLIVRVVGSKVGLSQRLAQSVVVCCEPCAATAGKSGVV